MRYSLCLEWHGKINGEALGDQHWVQIWLWPPPQKEPFLPSLTFFFHPRLFLWLWQQPHSHPMLTLRFSFRNTSAQPFLSDLTLKQSLFKRKQQTDFNSKLNRWKTCFLAVMASSHICNFNLQNEQHFGNIKLQFIAPICYTWQTVSIAV